MSIATEISRLQADRNTIRNKLVELGLATSSDNLDTLAQTISKLINHGAVSVTVKEGESYTIPAGYHSGGGTVVGVSGGGSYTLQAKSVTPTKNQQSVAPDSGYYGLSGVTVAPIPEAYQDVSGVTAAAENVLTGKVIVLADGTVTAGTMPNNGAVNQVLSATVVTYTIPKGYHSGTGNVTIALETKTVTPTKSEQTVTPSSGKVLSSVTVEPIPAPYHDVSGVTAEPWQVHSTAHFVNSSGELKQGQMDLYPEAVMPFNPLTSSEYVLAEGYYSDGAMVTLTDDLENALMSI